MTIGIFNLYFRGISLEDRKQYHIVNEKMVMYGPKLLVYDIHKLAIKHNIISLTNAHMELVLITYFKLD